MNLLSIKKIKFSLLTIVALLIGVMGISKDTGGICLNKAFADTAGVCSGAACSFSGGNPYAAGTFTCTCP